MVMLLVTCLPLLGELLLQIDKIGKKIGPLAVSCQICASLFVFRAAFGMHSTCSIKPRQGTAQ
jgi:hypothetical protein